MKHYRITAVIAVCLAVLLSSCSSDDEGGSNFPATVSQYIQAEWYSPDAERYLNFEFMYVTGVVYQNISAIPETAETFSGQWSYSNGGVLVMYVAYDKSLIGKTEGYYVLQCDDITLKMRHASLGLTLDYYKIVESYNARIGDRIDIAYVKNHSDFSSATYTTTNAGIADVDSDGRITVKGGGQAFVTVTSSAGSVIVKVNSGQRIDSYSAEISETIDQVIARHGEPDQIVNSVTGSPAIVYRTAPKIIDSAVDRTAYVYDADTREVTYLEVHYSLEGEQWFQYDENYLKSDFYLYLNHEDKYAPNPNAVENHYYISVINLGAGNSGFIIYNQDYISKHGHF